MKQITIDFPSGNKARAVHVPSGTGGHTIVAALGLPRTRAVLLVNGGASDMSPAEMAELQALLIEGVARVATEEDITIIDGGTQAGVTQMMGEGRAAAGGSAPLIGVCPAALVSWPGGPAGEDRVQLEPHHTHFVLTEGDRWGAETEIMFTLAAELSANAPSLAILANGGPVSEAELRHNVRQGREVIVIRGSGRLADAVAAAVTGNADLIGDRITLLIRDGYISLFDVVDTSNALAALVRQRLFEKPAI